VVIAETFMLGVFGELQSCSFTRCNEKRVHGWGEVQPLVLFGIVLAVRVLFLIGEKRLLLHTINHYQRLRTTPSTVKSDAASCLILAGEPCVGGGVAVESAIDFKRGVREILGGDTQSTIHVLIVIIFVQVTYWISEFRMVTVYDPSKLLAFVY
jgi:hypothetical protein